MTTEEHNKYLAYSHFGYAAFQFLMAVVMILFSFIIFGAFTSNAPRGEFPVALVTGILIFTFLIQLLLTVPSIIAGFGLLKRRRWARTASIVAAVMSAMSFPVGSAVCAYTFWFLFGANGKEFYERALAEGEGRPLSFLNERAGADAARDRAKRQPEYVPPREMPNWRD